MFDLFPYRYMCMVYGEKLFEVGCCEKNEEEILFTFPPFFPLFLYVAQHTRLMSSRGSINITTSINQRPLTHTYCVATFPIMKCSVH